MNERMNKSVSQSVIHCQSVSQSFIHCQSVSHSLSVGQSVSQYHVIQTMQKIKNASKSTNYILSFLVVHGVHHDTIDNVHVHLRCCWNCHL